jgi:hypothetical protein
MLDRLLFNKNVVIKVITVKNERHIYRLKNEPRSRHPREDEDQQARLIEYDDWMQQEEKRYSRLLAELNNARWLAQSHLNSNDAPDCGIDRIMNEGISSEMETTRLTDDEIRHGCGLTMEEALLRNKKPSEKNANGCLNRTITQCSISFQRTLSLSRDMREPGISEPIPWDSILIESGKYILLCWTENSSFSASMHCRWNEE